MRSAAVAVLLGALGTGALATVPAASAAPPPAPTVVELKSTTGGQPAQWTVPAGGQVVFKNSYVGLNVLGLISTTPVTVHFSDGRPDLPINTGATSAPEAITGPVYYTVNPGLLFVPLATVTDQGSITPQGQQPAPPPPNPSSHPQQGGSRPAASAPRPAPAPVVVPPPANTDPGTPVALPAPGAQEAVTLPPVGGDSAAPGGGQVPGGDELGPEASPSTPGHGLDLGLLLPALVAVLLLAGVGTGLVRTLRGMPLTRRQDPA